MIVGSVVAVDSLLTTLISTETQWSHPHTHCRGRTVLRFPTNSYHLPTVELALKGVLCTRLGSKGSRCAGLRPLLDPTAMPCWWAPIRAKQLSMAATARVIWLCACVRYWPYHGDGTCVSVLISVDSLLSVFWHHVMLLYSRIQMNALTTLVYSLERGNT